MTPQIRFLTLTMLTAFLPQFASAQSLAAREFHALLKSAVPAQMQDDTSMGVLHMIQKDQVFSEILGAATVEKALAETRHLELEELVRGANQTTAEIQALNADQILSRKPITLVIVPGIFSELIPTRPFEEVLERSTKDTKAFGALVDLAGLQGLDSATDESFNLETLETKIRPLDDLIHVSSLVGPEGRTLARVVLLYTPFMSMESMGELGKHAAIFNRRLAKYIELTGDENIAIVGYSRGSVLALEMLAQAKAQAQPWLKNVKGMISLGGVIWGSALADETENRASPAGQALDAIKRLRQDIDPNSYTKTALAWSRFSLKIASLVPGLAQKPSGPSDAGLKASPLTARLEAKSLLSLLKYSWTNLGLDNPFTDYDDNVRRFQILLDSAISGASSLTSNSRLNWWMRNELPLELKYYSLTAAMADPENTELERSIFSNSIGYGHLSYDDLSLLQNRLDYEAITGIALNDSQVSLPEAVFLPNLAAKLNPANSGMQTEFLGVMGTHHWGLALKFVFAMKDGRVNALPREALLKALAAKVSRDFQAGPAPH